MSGNRKFLLIVLQLAVWLVFLALPYFTVPQTRDVTAIENYLKHFSTAAELTTNIFLSSIPYNLGLIAFFYLNMYVLFDRFILKRRFLVYSVVVLCIYLNLFVFTDLMRKWFFPDVYTFHPLLTVRDFIRLAVWYVLVLLAGIGVKLWTQWRQAEQRASEVENDQLRTELSFLHAQINPHFLFNSLNTIYSLALKKADSAPQAVLKLSQLLRYVVDEAGHDRVPLDREVEYLKNYIELQRLRSTTTVSIDFNVTGNIESTQIAPMLLMPFVENAFKHGISNRQESPIEIKLAVTDHTLKLSVQNRKFAPEGIETEQKSTGGIGIANVRRRLALLYPEKHKLEINNGSDIYLVNLTINLV